MTSTKFRDEAGEPVRRFPDGSVGYAALASLVFKLLRKGHIIAVSDAGEVSIAPAVHEDTRIALEANWHGVRAAGRQWHARLAVTRELRELFGRSR